MRATAALAQFPSHMDSAWGTICLLLFASMGRNGTIIFLTDYLLVMEWLYGQEKIKQKQILTGSWKVWFSSRKTCWMFCLQWPQNKRWCFLLGNSKENERRIIWGLLLYSLPVILNVVSDTSWHATQRTSIFAKVEVPVAPQSVTSALLSVFLLPSSALMQECSETKIQGEKTNNYFWVVWLVLSISFFSMNKQENQNSKSFL